MVTLNLMKIFLLFLLIYFNFYSYSQSDYIKFIEDQYNGGVCFVGTNITYPFINLDIPIFIEPNSTIKSAFLIVNSKNKIDSTITIKINNFDFTSNQIATTNLINDSKSYTGGNWSMNHISIIECKDAIINLNNINIIVPEQQPSNPHALFDLFYFYIEYENPNLPLINTCLIFNE